MCKMEGIVIHAMYQKLGGGFSLRMPWLSGQLYTFKMGRRTIWLSWWKYVNGNVLGTTSKCPLNIKFIAFSKLFKLFQMHHNFVVFRFLFSLECDIYKAVYSNWL